MTVEQITQRVYDYTKECLNKLNEAGATPDFIQPGNEITYGMLWPTGHIYPDHKSENVQKNVKAYLKMLLEDFGYIGFRYDMVKGYSGSYTRCQLWCTDSG